MSEKASFFKRRKKLLIVLAVLLVLGVIVIANLQSRREKTVKVTVDKVKKQDLTSIISASGEIKPKKNINISAQVPGRIIKIGVDEGQEVKAGDFLLKLDSTQYEANADRDRNFIQAANAELIQAEARLQTRQELLRPPEEALRRRAHLQGPARSGQGPVRRLRRPRRTPSTSRSSRPRPRSRARMDNLAKTTYDSPIDGIITSLRVEEGEVAIIGTMNNPGTVLMTIADLSVMEVEVEVDETDVVGVRLGQTANVRVDAFPDTIFKGKVTEIGSSALQKATAGASTQESKDFKVVITLDNPARKLKPGLSASADIIVAEKKQALAVPISSLVLRDKPDVDKTAPGRGPRGGRRLRRRERPGQVRPGRQGHHRRA